MYVHVPYIYVLGTVRQCKEDFVTVQLPCKPTYTWYIPVKAFSRQTLCRRYAAKDHVLFNQNEKHDFNQILAYHFRIPAYHTTRFFNQNYVIHRYHTGKYSTLNARGELASSARAVRPSACTVTARATADTAMHAFADS
jgi:hypothetical protein